jgi:hypothetical protein
MGLDLATLFSPSNTIWWVRALKLRVNPLRLWGDGTNTTANYVGFALLGLFVCGVYLARKKISRFGVALLFIGLASFVLSLGPSLKIDSVRPSFVSGRLASSAYKMPRSDAVLSLPTEVLYRHVPGLQSMRATYRWHGLTLLALVAFAAIAVQMLLDRKRKVIAYLLLVLLCLELLPNPFFLIPVRVDRAHQLASFDRDVIDPLRSYVKAGDRILYFPGGAGGNDYLANYITPALHAWSYNVGGDKALAIAAASFPFEIHQLLRSTDPRKSGPRIKAVLQRGLVDKIVVPDFDLRWDAYYWPPGTQDGRVLAEQAVRSAEQTAGLVVQRAKYFNVIMLRR